jgi:hypothetical protein
MWSQPNKSLGSSSYYFSVEKIFKIEKSPTTVYLKRKPNYLEAITDCVHYNGSTEFNDSGLMTYLVHELGDDDLSSYSIFCSPTINTIATV